MFWIYILYLGFHRMSIDIHKLKDQLFNDLETPMGFLEHNGFNETEAVTFKRFGDSIYFYNKLNQKFSLTSPPSRVVSAEINEFTSDNHRLRLYQPWDTREQLKKCALMVHASLKEFQEVDFETFWKHCSVPNNIELCEYAFTRKKTKKFINIFKDNKELTGTVHITSQSIVSVNIQPVLSLTKHEEGQYQIGFKFVCGAGIQLVRLGGNPPSIQRPWEWNEVDFNTLSVPLYNSVIVKTPPLIVEQVNGPIMTVCVKDEHFRNAMNVFHRNTGVGTWDNCIEIVGRHKVTSGTTVIAHITPDITNKTMGWKTVTLHSSRPSRPKILKTLETPDNQRGCKREPDTMDNSSGVQTKRRCT